MNGGIYYLKKVFKLYIKKNKFRRGFNTQINQEKKILGEVFSNFLLI